MKILYALLLGVLSLSVNAQDFYDLESVQTIEVTFAESNWDQLMDTEYAGDGGYIMAQSVTINGITFDSIGAKFKGNSSYNANQAKNPWHIELNTYKDHEYDGYTDIKLANGAKDPSFLRDALGYIVIRQYMDAPLANFANLYVNGQLIGLYTNTESISKKFMNSRFGSKNNTRFKCSPPAGAGPQTTDFPSLVYLGQDSTDYYDSYELKSDAGWQEMIDLCDTIVNHTEAIDQIMDVDRALWMLAFDNVIVNLDSYIGAFAQNYYLYRSDYGQFIPVVWDLNESFGVFSQTGTINLNSTADKQQMTPYLHENDSTYPLVQNLLSIPMYKRMYVAHMKTMLLENFDNNSYSATAVALQSVIDASVQADGNKFFTYDDFINNLNSDIGGGGGGRGGGGASTPGITNLMEARSSYLLGLSDFTQTEPTISDITLSNASPTLNETITITATIADGSEALLGHRDVTGTAPFTKVEMYDDGQHGDGAANDGIYGVEIAVSSLSIDYFIYAENDNAGMFSPRRAEYEYYNIAAGGGNQSTEGVVINEFMASNDATITDPDGEYEDWIELYNNSTATIDLSGYYLTDDGEDLTQWTFPEGTSIAAGSYLIIWADNDEDQEGLHANFKLSGSGESVILVDATGSAIIDLIDYPEQTTDLSYARVPNGTGDFEITSATYEANNDDTIDCSNVGGDADNDGICADDDCDDNDPAIGASQPEGTACDDGDATTQSDVILADGCSCAGTQVELSEVVINEFMASNDVTASDQDGEFEDWIELYNNGTESVELSGYFLTDDSENLTQWVFPEGTSIAAGGYLIIWADEDLDQEGLHADFKLSGSGESVILVDASGDTVLDAVDYPEQTTDVSYARVPNGTGDFQAAAATFGDNNDSATDCSNAGGDADNDGICADDDCDDSDPAIGASQSEGTACDDGDAATQDDVILADGCTCEGTSIALSDVVINEFMASNDVTVADQDGEFEDWIELYNNGAESVDLSGYFLTDDSENLTQWVFPEGTSIAAGGYLIIWADGDLDQEGLHADFKLSGSGESVILVDASGTTIVDAVDYPEQTTDISYARVPNGTGDFQEANPTYNAENTISTSTEDLLINNELKIYPNPAGDFVFIEHEDGSYNEKLVTITNITGAIMYQNSVAGKTLFNTAEWAPGIYIVKSDQAVQKLFVE